MLEYTDDANTVHTYIHIEEKIDTYALENTDLYMYTATHTNVHKCISATKIQYVVYGIPVVTLKAIISENDLTLL